MKCPHCSGNIDVQFIKAPANMQSAAKSSAAAQSDDLGELLDMAEGNNLSGQSLEFVTETRKRYKQYGGATRMSDKQMNWLRKLANPNQEEEWQ